MAKGVSEARGGRRGFSKASSAQPERGRQGRRGDFGDLAQAVRNALLPQSLSVRLLGLGLTTLVTSAGALALTGCSSSADRDPVFDPRAEQLNERNNAAAINLVEPSLAGKPESLPITKQNTTLTSGTTLPTVIPMGGETGTDSPLIRLSLREIIQRTVANSSDVRVAGFMTSATGQCPEGHSGPGRSSTPPTIINVTPQRIDTQTIGTEITEASGKTPTLFYNKENVYTYQAGLQQNTPTGGKMSLTYQADLNDFGQARLLQTDQSLLGKPRSSSRFPAAAARVRDRGERRQDHHRQG